ncbi:hypothetical protein PsYK624_150200 [Phanerochaete sordida]|uniref:Uncharacterized protein n=1 Tax=Phanerochaete sordida TaxID=48140 RepID=A0A9P3LLK3_9APHY|nr:hypothetical protein PsYK624_150200 [Phanerochaete sordida]
MESRTSSGRMTAMFPAFMTLRSSNALRSRASCWSSRASRSVGDKTLDSGIGAASDAWSDDRDALRVAGLGRRWMKVLKRVAQATDTHYGPDNICWAGDSSISIPLDCPEPSRSVIPAEVFPGALSTNGDADPRRHVASLRRWAEQVFGSASRADPLM